MRGHYILTLFCLFGYLATAVAFLLRWNVVGYIFIELAFALGALFVYLGLTIPARLVSELVTVIGNLVPICASCKRIRRANGSPWDMNAWSPVEAYFAEKHQTKFSHGICPECIGKLYPEDQEAIAAEMRKQ